MSERLALDLPAGIGGGEATRDLPGSDGRPRKSVNLHAGQVYASAEPSSVSTILGSCVAVCLYDPLARVGGMNHFLLPHPTARERSARFGSVAMAQLVEQVVAAGASQASLEAKVFGGASVLRAFRGRNLGSENVELALRALEAGRVRLVDHDVGGLRGRKLVFHTDLGAAWVRQL